MPVAATPVTGREADVGEPRAAVRCGWMQVMRHSQGTVVLPARMGFSIRRRYAPRSSTVHPRIVRGVGVPARAAVVDGGRAQLVVPPLVVVDLAEPVCRAVVGQPADRAGAAGVDGV